MSPIKSSSELLGNKKPYPAALDDCYDTLKWIKNNIDELGGRSDQIMVGGHSPTHNWGFIIFRFTYLSIKPNVQSYSLVFLVFIAPVL